ncbi:hypothetical protein D3C73_759190 [compost metagenome]
MGHHGMGFFALSSLKNRLFLAFLALILLPYSYLQFHSFNKIQHTFEQQIIHQNTEQLEQLKLIFENLRSTVFLIALRLEIEPIVSEVLNGDLTYGEEERRKQMDGMWNEINSKVLPSPYVYYSLLDRGGNQYASYTPKKTLTYDQVMASEGADDLRNGRIKYLWDPGEQSDLRPEDSKSSRLLTLYLMHFDEQQQRNGLLRIGIDFQAWLSSMARSFPITQDFFLLDERGTVLGGTGEQEDTALTAFRQTDSTDTSSTHQFNGMYLYNRMPVPAMKWTLVSRFRSNCF